MLNDLIEEHKAALVEFEAACEKLDAVGHAWDEWESQNKLMVNLYNISPCVDEGVEWLRHYVDDILRESRRQLPFITSMSAEFAEQFNAFICETQATLYARIDEAIAEDERRKEAFGLTAARKHFDDISNAEKTAVNAICAYRCTDHDEERKRLQYLINNAEIMQMIDDFTPLLTQAIAA